MTLFFITLLGMNRRSSSAVSNALCWIPTVISNGWLFYGCIHRRVPFHLRGKVEDKLRELQRANINEPVDEPTPCISPIVPPPKPNNSEEIWLCVDMRGPNKAIKWVHHIMPTIDGVLSDLNGAKFFSKLDLVQGYHQLLLNPESSQVMTFSTHAGLWRYKRLNFWISWGSEIFQNAISSMLNGISGTQMFLTTSWFMSQFGNSMIPDLIKFCEGYNTTSWRATRPNVRWHSRPWHIWVSSSLPQESLQTQTRWKTFNSLQPRQIPLKFVPCWVWQTIVPVSSKPPQWSMLHSMIWPWRMFHGNGLLTITKHCKTSRMPWCQT